MKKKVKRCLVDDDQVAVETKMGDADGDVFGCLKTVEPIVVPRLLSLNLFSTMLSEISMSTSEIFLMILQIMMLKLWL